MFFWGRVDVREMGLADPQGRIPLRFTSVAADISVLTGMNAPPFIQTSLFGSHHR